MTGFLVLEDKSIFEGTWIGNTQWMGVGEVVFNTSLVGYQEVLTDPSYYQQIIVMTAPEQGNYGVAEEERESRQIWAEGFVCTQMNTYLDFLPADANKTARKDLQEELSFFKKPALTNLDTRALTLHIRMQGTPWGALVAGETAEDVLSKGLALISERKKQIHPDWVYPVSVKKPEFHRGVKSKGRVAVLDFGYKTSIVDQLKQRFSDIAVFNSRTKAADVLKWEPHGVMLTNGPGNPQDVEGAVGEVKQLLGQTPIFGICMGHQILALALGGKTYKLKFGHRGSNHPVRNLMTGEVYMTAQNHGYAVQDDLPSGVAVSQINLYDKTIEGLESISKKAWSVQYHPEAGPGPHDSRVLFDHFASAIL